MNDTASIARRIGQIFLDRLGLDIPSPGTDLFESGAVDSMAFVELLALLEEEFGFEIPLEDLDIDRFRSIESIAGFVTERGRLAGTA